MARTHSHKWKRRLTKPAIFLALQAVCGIAFAALLFARSESPGNRPLLPTLKNQPTIIRPQYDLPQVITDEQLATVLHRLRPRLRHDQPKINHVDHALRFVGVEGVFADRECLSGAELRQLLTNHAAFAEVWGDAARPLLLTNEKGVSVRTQQGAATASHVDHTLATLAEVGTPLDFVIHTADGASSLREVLEQALLDFRLNQLEYEWTALAAALYATSNQAWFSQELERITFDRLAERLMRQQLDQGVCFGNHRLYTLAILLRVDKFHAIFEDGATRQRIIDHLSDVTARLIASQSPEGYWDQNWHNAGEAIPESKFQPLTRQLLATGHALEWWAMAPAEVLPPREVLIRAGQWLAVEVEKMQDATIIKNYTFLSHVGRALSLWRGGFPHEQQQRLQALTAEL